jgi:uncharacterized protein (TIGR00645 family)
LQIFLNVQNYTSEQLMWATIIHIAFVISALMLGFLEQIMTRLKK